MTFNLSPDLSYDGAMDLVGTYIETPIGTLRCTGAGFSGNKISLSFHDTNGKIAITWCNDSGWETREQAKAVK